MKTTKPRDAARAALVAYYKAKKCERLPDGYCAKCHSEMYP